MVRQILQDTAIDWVKTQGTWAVLFVGLVIWGKPNIDRLIEAHFNLIQTLKESDAQQTKLLLEMRDLLEGNQQILKEAAGPG